MKKIIDGNGRLFGRVSVIDIVVVIIAAIIVIAFYAKYNVHDTPMSSRNTSEVSYTIEITSIRQTAIDLLREGDRLYLRETGTDVGEITDIAVVPSEVIESRADGTFTIVSVEDRFDVTLTVKAECSVSNGRIYVDRSTELNSNMTHGLLTKYNDFVGLIMSIGSVEGI